jgi:hypothetical protein
MMNLLSMAQKTPLPAKTVTYADRWNATWFVDLSQFQKKLQEDYHLRFLVTCFLRIKRYWLYRFSLNYSNGLYFLQLAVVMSQDKIIVKEPLFPTKVRQKILKKQWVPLFNKAQRDILFLRGAEVNTWEKRLSYTQEATWLSLSAMGYRNHNIILWLAKHKYNISKGSIFYNLSRKDYLTLSQTLNLNDQLALLQQASPVLMGFWYSQTHYNSLTQTLLVLNQESLGKKSAIQLEKYIIDFYAYMVFWPTILTGLLSKNLQDIMNKQSKLINLMKSTFKHTLLIECVLLCSKNTTSLFMLFRDDVSLSVKKNLKFLHFYNGFHYNKASLSHLLYSLFGFNYYCSFYW